MSVIGDNSVTLTGQQATYSLGTVTVTADSGLTLTGQQATYSLGTVTITGTSAITLTGVQATWYVNPEQYPLWAWTKETGGATTEIWTRELGKAA